MNGLYKTILEGEARIGGKVFGDSKDTNREFYCLDANTWVWRQDSTTTFYKINPSNVYKTNDGISYRRAGREETSRLFEAAKIYQKLIKTKVYGSLLALH